MKVSVHNRMTFMQPLKRRTLPIESPANDPAPPYPVKGFCTPRPPRCKDCLQGILVLAIAFHQFSRMRANVRQNHDAWPPRILALGTGILEPEFSISSFLGSGAYAQPPCRVKLESPGLFGGGRARLGPFSTLVRSVFPPPTCRAPNTFSGCTNSLKRREMAWTWQIGPH